jgi:hypothetical protein
MPAKIIVQLMGVAQNFQFPTILIFQCLCHDLENMIYVGESESKGNFETSQ